MLSTKEYIEKYKVIAICRRLYGDNLMRLAHALRDGGVRLMEITFDQADPECLNKTSQAITALTKEFGAEMMVGAGTVVTAPQVGAAEKAGARYIISPNTDIEVISKTKELGLVSIPGAMTPSEIIAAHKAGADFVKLFPSGTLGMKYIKEILSPISNVKFVATGGVREETLPEYLELGFAGAGVSGRLTDKGLIEKQDFAEFERRARAFMDIVAQY